MHLFLLLCGLTLLAGGGELLVRGCISSARALGVSPLLIGLIIAGFGTSMPELAISLSAAFQDAPGIVVGNVIGSNTANILLVMGASALIAPLTARLGMLRRDGVVLIGATIACAVVVLYGHISRPTGLLLVVLLAVYLFWSYRQERNSDADAQTTIQAAETAPPASSVPALLIAVAGIVLVIVGAQLLIHGAVALARGWGVSEATIGLTVIALGTSLPELVASVAAAFRGHPDVALGNVIGSCIYNIFAILGLTAIVHPISVPLGTTMQFDILVMSAATVLLLIFLRTGWCLSRLEGGVFLSGYVAYIAYLAMHGA